MKNTKLIIGLIAGLAFGATAQSNKVTGEIQIDYHARWNSTKGITDNYKISGLKVCDSIVFNGVVDYTPIIVDKGLMSDTISQNASLGFNINCNIMNPKNTNQVIRDAGRIYGKVPITSTGVYRFNTPNDGVKIIVYPRRGGTGYESKFDGTCTGKPLVAGLKKGIMDTIQKQTTAFTVKKQVKGKVVSITMTNYDSMTFESTQLCGGPVGVYGEVIVSGGMAYDYEKYIWAFNNMVLSYKDGTPQDRISGTIRWIESDDYKNTGEGYYEFDVRVNEPLSTASSAFTPANDASAFFESDNSMPGLIGTFKYKGAMKNSKPINCTVTIDLTGNLLNDKQIVALTKLLIFTTIIPMNAE